MTNVEVTARVMWQMKRLKEPINKYIYLSSLCERNHTLFYYVMQENLEELMPIVYTPTVGEACQNFQNIWRQTEGLYICEKFKGNIRHVLDDWPMSNVDIIVLTDGSRILGLGDLGVNGMGIPIGKLHLYVAAAGFNPARVLPVVIDVGTNNEHLLESPFYMGLRKRRTEGEAFYSLVDELMDGIQDKWPNALVQFEDFQNEKAFGTLERYRHKYLCFNDDIQGTGAVTLAGFISAIRRSGHKASDQKIVLLGAGASGTGVAEMIAQYIAKQDNVSVEQARSAFYLIDTKGLVTESRGDRLASHKVPFARKDIPADGQLTSLLEVVQHVKPTVMIGLSGDGGAFNEEIVRTMDAGCQEQNCAPIIFALSNPTSKAECTFEQAMKWTNHRCTFAAGSPFQPVTSEDGTQYRSPQCNNMYIFPGLGFGAWAAEAKEVTDKMIMAAAMALSECVTDADIAKGLLFPGLKDIRSISAQVATAVITQGMEDGAVHQSIGDIHKFVTDRMYVPAYQPVR
mgnify:FL=1